MKMVKRWLDVVIGVFEKTADNRRYDGGMAVLLDSAERPRSSSAAQWPTAAKLESVLREFVAEVKEHGPRHGRLDQIERRQARGCPLP